MKKLMTFALACAMLLLTACGGEKAPEVKDVDLTSLYEEIAGSHEWAAMTDIEGEMLESYYPGIGEIATVQLVAKTPLMSAVVNEMVFLQAEDEEGAAAAAEILQARIDMQAEGGAWYPESMEAWGRGTVIQQGTYVAMIASAENQQEIEDAFNNAFA